jgi:hypothetical protein
MSIQAKSHVARILRNRKIRPSEEKLLATIAELIPNQRHACCPGLVVLALRAGLCHRTTKRAIKGLTELGLIVTRRRYNVLGKRDRSEVEIVGLKSLILMRKETKRISPTKGHTKGHTRGQNVPTSYIKGKSAKNSTRTAQGAQTVVASHDDELVHPVTGELLPIVGAA